MQVPDPGAKREVLSIPSSGTINESSARHHSYIGCCLALFYFLNRFYTRTCVEI